MTRYADLDYRVTSFKVPMRDDIALAAIAFFPTHERPAPTLMVMTPYGITDSPTWGGSGGIIPNIWAFLEAGYAVVRVDCRGTFASDGQFVPKIHEAEDAYDAIDWISRQPWSNGKVGTYGPSYLGMTQWAAAVEAHPAHSAMVPSLTSMDWYRGLWYHPGGGMSTCITLVWAVRMMLADEIRDGRDSERLAQLLPLVTAGLDVAEINPVRSHPVLSTPWFDDWLAHPTYDDFWRAQDFTHAVSRVQTPALLVAGWYDIFAKEQLRDFERLRSCGATDEVREGSRLIVGPWDHFDMMLVGRTPDRDYGLDATPQGLDLTAAHKQHFDRWMTEQESGQEDEPPRVQLFVMGIDRWREESDWPLPDARDTDYHLVGTDLTTEGPAQDSTRSYVYDPKDPVRTTTSNRISAAWEASDRSGNALREDVLTFETAPLGRDTEVTGYVSAVLYVSSDAPDTDFMVQLLDVFPDGRAIWLCEGMIRARYRDGFDHPTAMKPGEVYEMRVDVGVTANVFLAGHRIRVDVSSSNFPRFDRNTNTGGDIGAERIDQSRKAKNTLHSGPHHRSRVILPRVDRS